MRDAPVEARDLTLGYRFRCREVQVAEGLDFAAGAGQMVCLVGPNGAGKSTLLRTLSGELAPLSGSLRVGGREPSRLSPSELAETMSLVLNELPANMGICAGELVSLGRLPHAGVFGRLSAEDLAAVDAAMERVSCTSLRNRPFGELSDGERARVQVARALAQDTPLILLDEPTAHLDWPSRIALSCLLRSLAHDGGKTVFLSTHELDLALQGADQWILLAPQLSPRVAAPEELALDGSLTRAFGTSGFRLDAVSGQIRLDRSTSRGIRLTGEGEAREWTARALERLGWRPEANAAEEVTVERDGEGFLWHCRGEAFRHLEPCLRRLMS